MLGSGCMEGVEMRRAWGKLTVEETDAREWLGSEVGEVFDVPLAAFGKGSVTGETRKKITSCRENTLAFVLAKDINILSKVLYEDISSLPGVRFSESSIGLKYYKYDYRWARILD